MRALLMASLTMLALGVPARPADGHAGALAFWKASVGEGEVRSQVLVPLAALDWLSAEAGTQAPTAGDPLDDVALRALARQLLPLFEVVEDGRPASAAMVGVRQLGGGMIEIVAVHALRPEARHRVLRSSYHEVVGRIESGRTSEAVVFSEAVAEHPLPDAMGEGSIGAMADGSFVGMVRLGLVHIVTGYDHVLFLLCLLVPGGTWRSRAAIVTAFTVAHSVTLVLAALQLVVLPPRFVEVAITLSLAYVAIENLLLDGSTGRLLDGPRRRWPIAFGFGLVHGFGFAGQLDLLHLPVRDALSSLVAFNAGIEAGQLAIVAIAAPALAWVTQQAWHRRLVQSSSVCVCGLAAWWVVERLS